MERILYITAYVPHKAAAGEKNTMIMLKDLATQYEVDLIYYKYDNEASYIPEHSNIHPVRVLKNSTWIKIWGIMNYPLIHPVYSIRFQWSLVKEIRELIKQRHYKAIILNHSNVFLFGKFLPLEIPKLLFAHDVIVQRVSRSSSWIMKKLCMVSERWTFNIPNSFIFSFSKKDCDLIKSTYKKVAHLCLDYIDEQIISKVPSVIKDYYTLFGDWRRKENADGAVWLMNHVLPLLNKPTCIKVIGRCFPNDLIPKDLMENIKIEVLGFVDDPYQIITDSKAMLAPLFQGAGIKVKVIESLACGTPVIGTDIAFEGLPDGFERFMILRNDALEFAEAMESVSMSVEERLATKSRFIKSYQQDSITNFIGNIRKR